MSDEKPVSVKADLSLKADLAPIIEKTPNGISRIYELLFGVKHAHVKSEIKKIEMDSQGHEALHQAQLSRLTDLIKNGDALYDSKKQNIVLIDAASRKANIDEINNILGCVVRTVESLEGKDSSSNEPISTEFFNRWRNEAKLIQSEDLRGIWGSILAEEIRAPSSISLRTLDVLRNLSRSEVEAFMEICPYVLRDNFLPEASLKGRTTGDLLSEAGLLNLNANPFSLHWEKSKIRDKDYNYLNGHVVDSRYYIIRNDSHSQDDIPFTLGFYLTNAGVELYKIACENITFDYDVITKTIMCSSNGLGELWFIRPLQNRVFNVDTDLIKITNEVRIPTEDDYNESED
ncbi:DUF2806 domain-containing protein [Pantoea agglomerans]|uniref:DUF2806 domain-containing protein n=1 Tax=Enterobacter agglomerans TaxID=549 RepID=UPI003018E5ED